MRAQNQTENNLPLKMVGSTVFGRYPKISQEQTWNMIISDDWLVDYAGYKQVANIGGSGRGIYSSTKSNNMFAVVDNKLYLIGTNLIPKIVGNLSTYSGDIFIDEDIQGNIAVCDKLNIYNYNYLSNTFNKAYTGVGNTSLNFIPGYVAFHDGRFISTDESNSQWRLSDPSSSNLNYPNTSSFIGSFQTKPDAPICVVRFPGKSNLILVIGKNVAEHWYDVGAQLFPYQKNTSHNIDYGCLNAATVAFNENIIVWLGTNEKSGPVIMYTSGGDINKISTDGIDFKFANLSNPSDSYGFLFKQDGHLLYQLTFPTDNLTYTYDFNTGKFFTLCDEQMNHHIAKKCVFFNNTYYFISFLDGNLYELNSKYSSYIYANSTQQIPRIRVTNTVRLSDGSPFIVNNITFPIEQGSPENNTSSDPLNIPSVDISISNDGGQSFGNSDRMQLNAVGKRQNRFIYWNLGYSNEFIPQFRFWANGRFVIGNGTMIIYQ